MHPKACFALFALGLALAHAIPASRIEKISVNDEPAFNKDLKAEELGNDKERAKKSTFCMDIKDKGAQVSHHGSVQTLNLRPQTQGGQQMQAFSIPSAQQSVQTYNIPSAQQSVQTYHIPSAQQSVQPMQAYSIPSAQQGVQTMSVIHTQSQPPAPQAVVIPQPVQPIHTLQIIQPPQPCPQQPSVNIQYQQPPTKEVEIVEVKPKPTPAPEPQTTPQPPARIVKPHYITNTVMVPQVEQMSVCNEQMVVKPMFMVEPQKMATVLKVPHCPHSHLSSVQCNCRPTSMSIDPMSIMTMHTGRMMGGHALVTRQANATEEKKA